MTGEPWVLVRGCRNGLTCSANYPAPTNHRLCWNRSRTEWWYESETCWGKNTLTWTQTLAEWLRMLAQWRDTKRIVDATYEGTQQDLWGRN